MATSPAFVPSGLGWQRDLPDPRDYTPESSNVRKLLAELEQVEETLPSATDLRADADGIYFSPPQDQGGFNASAAFACVSLIEYFERRVRGHTYERSPLFTYHMTLRRSAASGNAGAGVRATLKALRRYGSPPADMMSDLSETMNERLMDISLLGFTEDVADMVYFRLDHRDSPGSETLRRVRAWLAAGFPVAFGFSVPGSSSSDADIPFRPAFDSYRGGQTVLAVGYNDEHFPGKQGGILFRGSWGTNWGDGGCGWLPYPFISHQLAADFWTVISNRWIGSRELRQPVT